MVHVTMVCCSVLTECTSNDNYSKCLNTEVILTINERIFPITPAGTTTGMYAIFIASPESRQKIASSSQHFPMQVNETP